MLQPEWLAGFPRGPVNGYTTSCITTLPRVPSILLGLWSLKMGIDRLCRNASKHLPT